MKGVGTPIPILSRAAYVDVTEERARGGGFSSYRCQSSEKPNRFNPNLLSGLVAGPPDHADRAWA